MNPQKKKGSSSVKTKLPFAAFLLLLCLLLTAPALAASRHYTAVSPASGEEQVISRSNSRGEYLCLPGSWDLSAVLLRDEKLSTILLGQDKLPVQADQPVDLRPFLGQQTPVYRENGFSLGSIMILQGSPVLSLHFTLDPQTFSLLYRNKDKSASEGSLTVLEADGSVSYRGPIARFAGRGNDTFRYVKKPFEFKLPEKISPGGIDKGKTWILLANYMDVSFLRNQISLDLCRAVGLPFSIECVQADLYINGDYQGLYLLAEKIQIGKNRVSITDLEEATEAVNEASPSSYPKYYGKSASVPLSIGYNIPNDPQDITGGYIAVVEKRYRMESANKPCFRTSRNLNVRIKEPTCPSRAQVEYFSALVEQMHQALLSPDGKDPASSRHFSEILDVSSFALKYLVEDLTMDYDIMAGSQYFYKDSDLVDPLIYAGPGWDYDLTFGAMGENPVKTYASRVHTVSGNLWPLLAKQDLFMDAVREKWASVFRPALSVLLGESPAPAGSPLRSLRDYAAAVESSAAMDALRRGTSRPTEKYVGKDFSSALDRLESFLRTRRETLDSLYGN